MDNFMDNKKQEQSKQQEQPSQLPQPPQLKMRQIIIETNGNVATIVKAEVAGSLELKAILQGLVDNLR